MYKSQNIFVQMIYKTEQDTAEDLDLQVEDDYVGTF